MKYIFLNIFLFVSSFAISQEYTVSNSENTNSKLPPNEQLAQNYFDHGEFDKAIIIYEQLANSLLPTVNSI